MSNLCNNCGASASADVKTCEYCGSLVDVSTSIHEINIEICVIADTAFNADNFKEAIIYYDKILEQDKSNSNAWLRKGRCMLLIGKKNIYEPNPNDTNSLSEGLLCLNNALRFSNSKKVTARVLSVLTSFLDKNDNIINFDTIEIIIEGISSIKKIKNQETIPLIIKAINAFEKNILSEKRHELDFYLDFNKNVINPALEIKKNKVISEYNDLVKLIREYEEKSGLSSIKEDYKNYFSTKNNPSILEEVDPK
jgi:tetratricopeptide (TPR) repeat protein